MNKHDKHFGAWILFGNKKIIEMGNGNIVTYQNGEKNHTQSKSDTQKKSLTKDKEIHQKIQNKCTRTAVKPHGTVCFCSESTDFQRITFNNVCMHIFFSKKESFFFLAPDFSFPPSALIYG